MRDPAHCKAHYRRGCALEKLGRPEEALALGDAENDVEMLRLVGVGVAMGNANAAAKAAADVVVATSDNDGVAEAVRRFALGGERAPLSSKS